MSGSPLVKSKFRRLSPSDITLGGIVHERSMVYEATWSPPDTGETVTVAVKIMETLRENSVRVDGNTYMTGVACMSHLWFGRFKVVLVP